MIADVIEERMCEMIREAHQEEAEDQRVMVNLHPDRLRQLDNLRDHLGLSRADLGGRLLEAAVEEAFSVYTREVYGILAASPEEEDS
jgi:hypothetical protein